MKQLYRCEYKTHIRLYLKPEVCGVQRTPGIEIPRTEIDSKSIDQDTLLCVIDAADAVPVLALATRHHDAQCCLKIFPTILHPRLSPQIYRRLH